MKLHTPAITGTGDFCARSSWSKCVAQTGTTDAESAFEAELFAALLVSDEQTVDVA